MPTEMTTGWPRQPSRNFILSERSESKDLSREAVAIPGGGSFRLRRKEAAFVKTFDLGSYDPPFHTVQAGRLHHNRPSVPRECMWVRASRPHIFDGCGIVRARRPHHKGEDRFSMCSLRPLRMAGDPGELGSLLFHERVQIVVGIESLDRLPAQLLELETVARHLASDRAHDDRSGVFVRELLDAEREHHRLANH
jgi:hypothetical protein